MKKIIVLSLICIFLFLALTGCYNIEPEELEKLSELVESERSNFTKQASSQYGKKSRVTSIQGQRVYKRDPLLSIVTAKASGNLTGRISNEEYGRFNAVYLVDRNEIISDKNNEKIKNSTKKLLESTGVSALNIKVSDLERKNHIVEDDIDTFEKVLDAGGAVFINSITENDIDELRLDEVYQVMEKYAEKGALLIEIVQVNKVDKIKLNKLMNAISNEDICIPTEMYNYVTEKENRINEYNIKSHIRIRYDKDEEEGRMEYVNKYGEKIYRTSNGKELFYSQ